MTSSRRLFALVCLLGMVTSCRNQPPAPAALQPKGTDCAEVVIACFDEFARQPAKFICFREQSRWSRTELTWRLAQPLTSDALDLQTQTELVEQAFQQWSDASNLLFQMAEGNADISISFHQRSHGDDFPFDGAGNNLGHAFFPGSSRAGEIHLCADETWGTTGVAGGFELLTALVHEIGHALGLEHSLDADAVMAPSYQAGRSALTQDDIDALQLLYGSRGGDVPPIIERPADFEAFCADAGANLTALGDPDTDEDGIPDTMEVFVLDTEPVAGDSDGDNVNDFTEVVVDRTDPNDRVDFNPDSVMDTEAVDTNNQFSVTVFRNGAEFGRFALGDGSAILLDVDPGDGEAFPIINLETVAFVVFLTRGCPDEVGSYTAEILFGDLAQLDGTPVSFDEPGPLLAFADATVAGELGLGVESSGGICPDVEFMGQAADSCQGGTVSLTRRGGRVSGSFDFTVISATGGATVRATGSLNLPETFMQEGANNELANGCAR